MVDMLEAHKSFARVKADKSFQEVLELLGEDSLEYFRIILRKNQNLFGILTNQAIVKDILEIAIRGINIGRKEYFIFIYLDKNKLNDLKKRHILNEVGLARAHTKKRGGKINKIQTKPEITLPRERRM